MPDIAKTILLESEKGLSDLITSGAVLPDTKIGRCSLLELAFGWPKGISILLEIGANEENSPFSLGEAVKDIMESHPDHAGYYHSAMMLLDIGWTLGVKDIARCRSRMLIELFDRELAARRKRLWELAQSYLPCDQLPHLDADEILDYDATYTYATLRRSRIKVDSSLRSFNPGLTVYHQLGTSPYPLAEALEELYQAGFHSVDVPGKPGVAQPQFSQMTPIMLCRGAFFIDEFLRSESLGRSLMWFISKGADVSRQLPGTNARVAHLLSDRITTKLINLMEREAEEDIKARTFWIQTFRSHKKRRSLAPVVRDACVCACCLDGYTTLSVALRLVFGVFAAFIPPPYRTKTLLPLLDMLIEWHKDYPNANQIFLRCFTFDALNLTHTCCDELSSVMSYDPRPRKSESEIAEILEEQQEKLNDLDYLVSEFEAKLEELNLPVLDFLQDYWHPRMIRFFSQVDPYDEEHHKGANELGVVLEVDERPVPYRLFLLVGRHVQDVTNEEDLDGLVCWWPASPYTS
ncbi:hypothetical protein BJY04DRAFT_143346 [Aspergillus karnatakaensis]|uniref:uncharacterized protein n=1 Tax=Aspergillus karnatakaensis TaxID=1810916 RepID=UPI003CCE4E5F